MPMSRSTTVQLQVTLSPDQLDELASKVVQRILTAAPNDAYDQDHLPMGLSRRVYLDAARAGAFDSQKVGKKVIAKRADVDAWIASRPSARRAKEASSGSSLDDDIATIVANNGARLT